jgi:hypothetical protein
MKKQILIWVALVAIHLHTNAQSRISAGMGYFGENVKNMGLVLEFEYEKMHTGDFSLPVRVDLGHHTNPDYHVQFIDIHKGFRKYFANGLFVEQSLGVGLIGKNFKTDSYWYHDKYMANVAHGGSTVWGFMPSVTAGLGYNFAKGQEGADILWVRPKIYWDLGFRGLHLPYAALQVGFTHTFKTK